MSQFTITDTSLVGVKVIRRTVIADRRGFLSRVFSVAELTAAGWRKPVVQINHTRTIRRGTVRGMHFQRAPNADMKLVTCLRGAVWDVAVDLRGSSTTLLGWHAEELSAENRMALLIPEGVAHGFQALSDDCELLYLHSVAYAPESDAGVNPSDPAISIRWPLPITEMSDRDQAHPMLSNYRGERA